MVVEVHAMFCGCHNPGAHLRSLLHRLDRAPLSSSGRDPSPPDQGGRGQIRRSLPAACHQGDEPWRGDGGGDAGVDPRPAADGDAGDGAGGDWDAAALEELFTAVEGDREG